MVCSEVTLLLVAHKFAEDTGLQSTVKTIFHMTNISRVGGEKKEKKQTKKTKQETKPKPTTNLFLKSLFHSIKPV